MISSEGKKPWKRIMNSIATEGMKMKSREKHKHLRSEINLMDSAFQFQWFETYCIGKRKKDIEFTYPSS